ncbi:hypothetical protein [Salinibius halmophilus]|uniref:hypothetical protein n=1 Tax=Salinibius halmophilus TaxID=1853216 RepID=UPI0013141660|nr:hypothetical protein [Salinibius halmophilus]
MLKLAQMSNEHVADVAKSTKLTAQPPRLTLRSSTESAVAPAEVVASAANRLDNTIDMLTQKPSDADIVETGFGKMLVLGDGGQTVVVARMQNGQVVVEEY